MNLLIHIVIFCLTLLAKTTAISNEKTTIVCLKKNNTSINIKFCGSKVPNLNIQQDIIVYARFANRINVTGWSELDIVTSPAYSDIEQAYFAGYLEASLTHKLIRSYGNNIHYGDECKNASHIIKKSLNRTLERAKKNLNDPYWHEVLLTLYQISGLEDGYYNHFNNSLSITSPNTNIRTCGLILWQLYPEFDDLQTINQSGQQSVDDRDRCSAIVKLLPDNSDVYASHNTWSLLKTMLRMLKRYTFQFSTSQAKSLAFSGYPGTIFSVDDFYITSQHIVIQETTLQNFNRDLYNSINVDDMVFEFIRNVVANRLARTGKEWVDIYRRHNSGTYNNQFMIIDYKKFIPNAGVHPGFLYILEQLPTMVIAEDKTNTLINQTYWPSYNVAYFPEIYQATDSDKMAKKYGDHYSYENCARAQIFRRDHKKVTNMTGLYHLMRYNNYKMDPISRCNCTPPYTAYRAIASRADLNDPNGTYPFPEYQFRPAAALDAKLTNYQMAKSLQMIAVSGPTNENVPTFSWATTKLKNVKHYDQPIEWNFKPVVTDWKETDGFPQFEFNF